MDATVDPVTELDPVTEFLAVLREVDSKLAAAVADLAAAQVSDDAFGKLFEAHEVRDSYHRRLPNLRHDLDEAREVLGHFVAGLTGGHPIVDNSTDP
jgi:hypothetical protein